MRAPAAHARVFFGTGLALAALAWVLLFAWAAGPYARYLNHGDWTQVGVMGAVCATVPWGESVVPGALYVGGWVLMLTAMMLPTALPVLQILARMTARRPDGGRLVALAAAGYLAAWAGFGLAAHLADLGLAAMIHGEPFFVLHGWTVGAGVLLGAGLFQFSPLKKACLDRCRTPLGHVMAHWHGARPAREAFGLGLAHGLFCVGCCWALMLLMFVVGTGNVAWMLLLGLVMAAEKNFAFGRQLSPLVGLGLIAWAGALVALNLSGWLPS
jgi:predicted metal-binding membrane protein